MDFTTLLRVVIFGLCMCMVISMSIDTKNENKPNSTEATVPLKSDEDYEYVEEEDPNKSKDFVDKLRELHRRNGNKTVTYIAKHINETFDAVHNFRQNFKYLFRTDEKLAFELLEFIGELDIKLSTQCSSALFRIYTGLKQSEIWAMRFIDSMGRFPSPGFIDGLTSSFGEFDQCLDSRTPDNMEHQFEGKYCLLNVKLPYPELKSLSEDPVNTYNIKWLEYFGMHKFASIRAVSELLGLANGSIYNIGLCVPSVCTPDEISKVLNKILYPVTDIPLEVDRKCYTRSDPIVIDKYQWISISILSTLIILSTIGTVVHIQHKRTIDQGEKSNPSILVSFSFLKNLTKLFEKNEKFAALDTIRLLMIIHVHFGHIYQFATSIGAPGLRKQFSDVFDKVYSDNALVFARSPLPVDTLFTLSGFLLSYGLLRRLDRSKGRFNYPIFIFQRWIRFLILVFGSILFIYLMPLSGEGPIWQIGVNKFSNGCRNPRNLVNNLLFINNLNGEGNNFNGDKCHPVTWFLASLLQLTAIAPIFVIIYFKNKMIGIFTLTMGIMMGLFLAISPILFGLKPYLLIWDLDSIIFANSSSLTAYHTFPTVYLVSFLAGFPFGYLLHKNTVKLSKHQVRLFWLLSLSAIFSVYFWNNTFWRTDHSSTLINALMWHSVGKLAFGLGMGWLMYACCTGRGGLLNKILSWQGFQPVARLSFGIYLIHFLVITHRVFAVKDTYQLSSKFVIEHTIIDIIYDIILATIFYLLIEGPFSNLFERVFAQRPHTKAMVDENQNIENYIQKPTV